MNEETKKLCQFLLKEISLSKQYSEATAPHDLFISAETLISGLASLISPLMELETAYRQKVKTYMSQDMSVAKAEVYAKADIEYKDWKKVQLTYELAESQILLTKKFSDKLEMEYKRS